MLCPRSERLDHLDSLAWNLLFATHDHYLQPQLFQDGVCQGRGWTQLFLSKIWSHSQECTCLIISHHFSSLFMGYPVPGQAFENLTALHLRIPANGSLKRRLPGILIPTASIHILLISEKDLGFLSGFEPLQFLFRSKSSSFSKVWPSYRHSSSDISLNDENAVMKPPPDGWSWISSGKWGRKKQGRFLSCGDYGLWIYVLETCKLATI